MYAQAFTQGLPQGSAPETQNSFLFPAEDDLISPTASLDMENIMMSAMYEYDLGGDGDLFNAPELILREPMHAVLDPVAAAIYMMSETIEDASNVSPVLHEGGLLNEVFYECKRELMAVSAILEPAPPEASEIEDAPLQSGANNATTEGPLQKCVSFGCTSSAKSSDGGNVRPNFLCFHEVDLDNACGMRSYSGGDIKWTIGGNGSVVCDTTLAPSSFKLLSAFGDRIEERKQKIFRYQKKRTKRNFGRKIKYACRKALADSQPRVRGRFAKNEDMQAKFEEHEIGKQ